MRPQLTAIALVAALAAPAFAQELAPRRALETGPVVARLPQVAPPLVTPEIGHRLVVKFVDAVRARSNAAGEVESRAGADLTSVRQLATARGLTFSQLIRLPEAKLTALEERAAARSRVAQPDLAGMLIVDVPGGAIAALEETGNALQAIAEVEFAEIESLMVPPPGDIFPITDDYVPMQTYRGLDPGMDVDAAWAQNAKGSWMRLSDCEYGWNPAHEDLNDKPLHLEPGQTIHPNVFFNSWDEHGTAVLGETSAGHNAYGCSGMAPNSTVYTYPEWTVEEGSRRVTCITNAIADSNYGDVVLLEMQTTGPGGGYAPAEVSAPVYVVVKAGVQAGVVVVGAAGNGNQDLDSQPYANYMSWGDSGAIIVGAGSSNTNHDKLSFSTYGARVNVQGWGENVFTLGYGSFIEVGNDPNQSYTSSFSGTSSASPFIASACLMIQGYMKFKTGAPLSPIAIRNHLIATGLPQGSGGHIGPFPDMDGAISSLDVCTFWISAACTPAPNSVGSGAKLGGIGTTSVAANDFHIRCIDAPPAEFGFLFYGSEEVNIPFGDGTRCVGGPGLLRVLPPVQFSSAGAATVQIDFTQAPMSSGPGQITPGSTWFFEMWYRDPVGAPSGNGAGFNFSDTLGASFCW